MALSSFATLSKPKRDLYYQDVMIIGYRVYFHYLMDRRDGGDTGEASRGTLLGSLPCHARTHVRRRILVTAVDDG